MSQTPHSFFMHCRTQKCFQKFQSSKDRSLVAFSPAWWSWQAVLNFNHISTIRISSGQ